MTVTTTDWAGDLLEFVDAVEALVNPWNTNWVPWWLLRPGGVSGPLRARAGREVFCQLREHGRLGLGEAVVTGGGRLGGVVLVHVAVINLLQAARVDTVRTRGGELGPSGGGARRDDDGHATAGGRPWRSGAGSVEASHLSGPGRG